MARTGLPLTVALAALAVCAFAGNTLLTRAALADDLIGAELFAQIRFGSGAIALLAFAALTRLDLTPRRADIAGGLALAAYAVAFTFATVSLQAAAGALILFACVQATVLGAAMASGTRPGAVQLCGLAVALGGLAWLLAPSMAASSDAPPLSAAILMGVAGLAWGAYTWLGRGTADPVARTARNFVIASALIAPFLITALPQHASPAGIALALASGLLASGAGYAVWYAVLPRIPALAAGSVQLLTPAAAALGGVVLLAEPMSLRLIAASALILGGVALTLNKPRPAGPTDRS